MGGKKPGFLWMVSALKLSLLWAPRSSTCLLNLSPSLTLCHPARSSTRLVSDLGKTRHFPDPQSALFLPKCPLFSVQPAWWPTLAALALLSCITDASLDPMSGSPAARDGPSPVLAPPTDHLPGR